MKKYLPKTWALAGLELIKQGYADGDVANVLLHQLRKTKSLSMLPAVISEIEARQDYMDRSVVDVTAADALTEAQKLAFERLAEKLFQGPVAIRMHQKRDLLGGFTLRKEDEVLDFSLSEISHKLKQSLEH